MQAIKENRRIQETMARRLDMWPMLDDVNTLRRAAITLHGWYEHECNGYIERNEETGKPYRVWTDSNWKRHHIPTPDREKGAIKRIKEVCERLGLHYYLQTDPRGGTLYISKEPLNQQNYTNGFFVA